MRGQAILTRGVEPLEVETGSYLIPSQSSNRKYLVRYDNYRWTCECPDFHFRHLNCKHIHAVRIWLSIKQKLENRHDKNKVDKRDPKDRRGRHNPLLASYQRGSRQDKSPNRHIYCIGHDRQIWGDTS